MAAGNTVNVFEVLLTPPPVAVRVFTVPAKVSVTEFELKKPATKLAVVAPAVITEFVVSVTLPV